MALAYPWFRTVEPLSPYLPENLRRGLVLYLWMNEGSGNRVYDLSGNGNHATIYGATWTRLTSGKNALSFDGVDDYVEVQSTIIQPGSTSLTVLTWVRFNAIPYDVQVIVKQGFGSVFGNYFIYTQYEKFYRAALRGTDGASVTLPGVVVYPSTWYFLGLRYDGGEVSTWVNAEKKVSASFSSPIGVDQPTRIGHPYGISVKYLNGLVSGVLIYSRALSDAEIRTLYELHRGLFAG